MTNIHKFYPVAQSSQQSCKSRANIAYIKFCLRQNLKLIIGTANQQKTIEELRKDFPTALFVLVSDWGIEIKVKDRNEI